MSCETQDTTVARGGISLRSRIVRNSQKNTKTCDKKDYPVCLSGNGTKIGLPHSNTRWRRLHHQSFTYLKLESHRLSEKVLLNRNMSRKVL